jgi:hypothetical protein
LVEERIAEHGLIGGHDASAPGFIQTRFQDSIELWEEEHSKSVLVVASTRRSESIEREERYPRVSGVVLLYIGLGGVRTKL